MRREPSSGAAVQLLEALVGIPSVSGEEADASRFLVEWMSRRGFRASVDEVGNAVGTRGEGEHEMLLLGHIDTVPGVVPVRRDGSRLYGRGAVDAKGPLCAFAAAAAEVNPPPGWRITVVGAVEEEVATSRGARHVLETRRERPPACCVIGEPSRWRRVTVGYRGRMILNATLRAPLAHSAGEGPLPPEVGVYLWHFLCGFCDAWNTAARAAREFDRLTPALQSITSAADGTHGVVRLTIGFRLPPDEEPSALETRLRQALSEHEAEFEGVEWTWAFTGHERAFLCPKSGPLVGAFLAAIREAGGSPAFVVKTGTSDMNVVGPCWPNTSILAYGPGDSALDHTPDEHVDLEEYERAVAVLATVLRRLPFR